MFFFVIFFHFSLSRSITNVTCNNYFKSILVKQLAFKSIHVKRKAQCEKNIDRNKCSCTN